MTGREMNARVMKILVISAAAAAGAAGCASPGPAPGGSPMDARVQALVDANRSYPRWAEFPAAPGPLPSDSVVAGSVTRLGAEQAALARETSTIAWTLSDAEGFAAATRARVDAARAAPATEQTAETLEAFAESLRERGRAPPPIPRRQQP
jgi:hypothetical protein